jgi:hypothetical protein
VGGIFLGILGGMLAQREEKRHLLVWMAFWKGGYHIVQLLGYHCSIERVSTPTYFTICCFLVYYMRRSCRP